MGQMKSLYHGTCATCAKPIAPGEDIDYRGKGNIHHLACVQMSLPFIDWEPDKANQLADDLKFYAKGNTGPPQQTKPRNRQ